ncbi:MAG: hypothetical protein RBS68_08240 [Anaerolineales bacterium]|jgi:hypothetical protein|nr:hypothetical protein [Anaerolineales bacterium]
MNKKLQVFLSVLVALAFLAATSAPAFAAGPRHLSLLDIQHWSGKGLILRFEALNGAYTRSELKGSYALIGNNEFGMDCNIDDDGKVVCVVGDAIAQFTGRSATVLLAGQGFFITIPERKQPAYCYNIYGLMTDDFEGFVAAMEELTPEEDAPPMDEPLDPFETIFSYWYPATVGRECSATPPSVGDILNFDHPYEQELRDLFGPEFFNTFLGDEEGDLTTALFTDELLWAEAPEEMRLCLYQGAPAYYAWLYIFLGTIYCGGLIPV